MIHKGKLELNSIQEKQKAFKCTTEIRKGRKTVSLWFSMDSGWEHRGPSINGPVF